MFLRICLILQLNTYPACAVTRVMARRKHVEEASGGVKKWMYFQTEVEPEKPEYSYRSTKPGGDIC